MSIKTIIIMVLGIGFLYALFTVGFPFLLALVFAIALEPITQMFMKAFRLNRIAAATTSCTLFMLLLLGMVYLIGLKMISEFVAFWKKAPNYINEANEWFHDAFIRTKLFYETLPEDTADKLQNGVDTGINALTDSLNGLIAGISGSFFNIAKSIPNLFIFLIVFAVALYMFSYSLNGLKASFVSLFEERSRHKVEKVLQNLKSSIFGFFRAQLIISALTYLVVLLGLFILKVDYPLAIAVLIIIVDVLPILGTGSVIVPWAAFQLVTGDMFQGIGLLVLFMVITVFRRMIEPKILGDSVGIGALSALISLYVGFKLVGVIGLFLGPIVVIIYQAMRKVGLLQFKIKLE